MTSTSYEKPLPFIDVWGRENDAHFSGFPGFHEKINTGGLQWFQKVFFALGDCCHRGNPFSQMGGRCCSKQHRAAFIDERGSLERNNSSDTHLTDKYNIIAIHLQPCVLVPAVVSTLVLLYIDR